MLAGNRMKWAIPAVLVGVLLISGCGGGGSSSPSSTTGDEPLTKQELISQGDAICGQALDKFQQLEQNPPTTAEGAATLTQQLLEITETELAQLRALNPTADARFPTPASQSPARAPGRVKADERDHRMSVASSVPRSQASAHQSSGRPRISVTACAAAKVSQTGPLRRNSSRASGEGRSCPSAASVASGANSAPLPSARSKAIMLRLVVRRADSTSICARSNHIGV